MKRIFLALILLLLISFSSGCATILGGIIGHQSGETCAGLAIGAAVDFGGDIARCICHAAANPKEEFRQKSEMNANCGTIQLPGNAFTPKRMVCVTRGLQEEFSKNGWTYKVVEKTAKTGVFCKDDFREKWDCITAQGSPFTLNLHIRQDENQELSIQVPENSQADRAEITIQIYNWLEAVSAGKT